MDAATEKTTKPLSEIFNQTNINLVLWILAIFFIIKFVLGVVSGSGVISPAIDVIVFVGIIAYLLYIPKNEDIISATTAEFKREIEDYRTMIYLGVIVVILFAFDYLMGNLPFSILLIKNVSLVYLIFLGIVNFCVYVLNIPVVDMIFSPTEKVVSTTVVSTKDTGASQKDEVFNVSNNLYTYDDAKMVCGAMDARLATYDEIEDTYKNGGEWCNYGWSEGQHAYFPTQKKTWAKLQSDEKKKHNCGRPGINGGYMANPYIKFGANCFGKRPKPKDTDLLKLNTMEFAPKTPDEIILDQKVNAWKNKVGTVDINPFNHLKWSSM